MFHFLNFRKQKHKGEKNNTQLHFGVFPPKRFFFFFFIKMSKLGTSLVAQWLRIHLPMQGTRV